MSDAEILHRRYRSEDAFMSERDRLALDGWRVVAVRRLKKERLAPHRRPLFGYFWAAVFPEDRDYAVTFQRDERPPSA